MTRRGTAVGLVGLLALAVVLAGCGLTLGGAPASLAAHPPPMDLGLIQGSPRPTDRSGVGPRLRLPRIPLEIPGQLPLGTVVRFVFPITNDGDEPLIVRASQPGCGCTQATIASAPIAPGQQALVQVTFDTTWDGPGSHWEAINFVTNDPAFGETRPPLHADLWFAVDVSEAPGATPRNP